MPPLPEKRYRVDETKVFPRKAGESLGERQRTTWPLPPLTLEEARKRVWIRREWHRTAGATWELMLEIVDVETGAVMPEQEARRWKVRTSWTGWMKGAQTLDWPPDPVSQEEARALVRLARMHSPIALVRYDVVDVRTGETVTTTTDVET